MRLIRIRRKFSRLFSTDDTELAPAPGGEDVKEKSETVQALERELSRHGLDLADVVDLFAHDVASEDEDDPTTQKIDVRQKIKNWLIRKHSSSINVIVVKGMDSDSESESDDERYM